MSQEYDPDGYKAIVVEEYWSRESRDQMLLSAIQEFDSEELRDAYVRGFEDADGHKRSTNGPSNLQGPFPIKSQTK